jgi:uncharacterized protein
MTGPEELRRMMLNTGAVSFDVKVIPRAAKSEIVGFLEDGTLKVKLCAVPEKGKANAELCNVLGAWVGVSRHRVSILSGETSQRKRVKITRG